MASLPTEIPGIGAVSLRLVPNPQFNPVGASPALTSQDFFVLSRFDGTTTLKDLILMTGFPTEDTVAIIHKLRQMYAILLPGEKPPAPSAPPLGASTTTPPPSMARTLTSRGVVVSRASTMPGGTAQAPIANFDSPTMRSAAEIAAANREAGTPAQSGRRPATTLPSPGSVPMQPTPSHAPLASVATVKDDLPSPGGAPWSAAELAALREANDLALEQRAAMLRHARLVASGDRFAILGVPAEATKQDIKRAFFRLSKELHPDRYYGKQLGSFGPLLAAVFASISKAYEATSSKEPGPGPGPAAPGAAQSASDHAAELFERACQAEISGDAAGAVALFRAAIRLTPTSKFLRRGAMCALSAGQIPTAEEFARKGVAVDPMDVSMQRLLGQAFREAGKLAEAEEVLVMAMAIRTENDVLGAELRNDLDHVRRLIGRA